MLPQPAPPRHPDGRKRCRLRRNRNRLRRPGAYARARRPRGAADEWLYLLVLLESQFTVDRHMAARILAYTGRMYLKLVRGGEALPDGRLPSVLPVAIYNGERRWSAAAEMAETTAAVGATVAPFQPWRRHLIIDEHALRVEDLPEENVVSAQIALEQGSVPTMASVLRRLSALLAGAEHASLRRAFAELTLGMVERRAAARTHPELASALRAAAETGGLNAMGSVLARRLDEYIEAGVEGGWVEGLKLGLERERAMLSRLVERKFGAETGARLAALLADVADPERLAEIGDRAIDCADGAELLARAREGANRG